MKIVKFEGSAPHLFVYVQCSYCGDTYAIGYYSNMLILTFCTQRCALLYGLTPKEVECQWSILRELNETFLIQQVLKQIAEIDGQRNRLPREKFKELSAQRSILTHFLLTVLPDYSLFSTIDATGQPIYEIRSSENYSEEEGG